MSFDDFRRRAGARTLVPVWRDVLLDTDTPVSAFAKLRRPPFAFLLESAPAGGWHGARTPADPIGDLRALVTRYQPADVPELGAFWSGAVGFFGYDVVRLIERLPDAPPRTQDVPDALFIFTRALVIVDNLR